jgi:ClpP class serine protease
MFRAFQALAAEPWAIEPSWLPILSAIAQRHRDAPEVQAVQGREVRDLSFYAGPAVQAIPGARRAVMTADGVAIVPVTGPIFPRANMMTEMSGATSVATLQNDYRAALASDDVGAILLLIDSPGGAVSGINATADIIAQGKKQKYTSAFVAGTAASAAYWIASAANEIRLERTGMVGSIGVVAAVPKQVEPGVDGFVAVEIVSSNAPNKRPDPTTDDGAAQIRTMLDKIEAQFIADVARGRGVSAKTVTEEFGRGGIEVGADAVTKGMADQVSSYDAALGALAKMVKAQRRVKSLRK